jgi:tetratricopeptide (TPR) repeat protein
MDSASLEVWQYITTQFALKNSEKVLLHTCCGFRTAELEANLETSLLRATQDGIATLIEIKSLEKEGLVSLLHGLKLPWVTELAVSLEQYTGGNPMYVLETLKSLLETGGIERGLPQHFPPPQKIGALIRHRLERLSSGALRLARVAAVAETDFTLALAATILEIKTLELTQPLQELEMAQVLVGERFAHDLIFEATLAGVPNTIKILLHRRIAEYLETVNAAPARIAHHWLDASDFNRAVPAMINAAEVAQRMARDDEAIHLLELAIALPVVAGQRHLAQAMLGGIYVLKNRFEDAEHSLNLLLQVVSDPEAHWLALDHLCYLHIRKGSLETAQRYGENALELATLHGVASRLEETRYKLGVIAHYTGENQRAVELILPTVQLLREQPANVNFLNALGALGQSLRDLGRTNEALLYEDEMLRHAKTLGADREIANHLGNTLYRDFLSGDASEAISNAENYLSDLEQRGSDVDVCSLRSNMAAIYARLERSDEAIRQYTTLTLHANLEYHMSAWANLAVLQTKQLQPEAARLALGRALELAPDNDYPTPRFALIRAVYTLGTPEQRAQVQPYLDTLNFDALPASYRSELEELLETTRVEGFLALE